MGLSPMLDRQLTKNCHKVWYDLHRNLTDDKIANAVAETCISHLNTGSGEVSIADICSGAGTAGMIQECFNDWIIMNGRQSADTVRVHPSSDSLLLQ